MATLIQENGIKELSKGTHGVVANHAISSHGVVANHGISSHGVVANHGISTHGVMANHGISTHGTMANHGISTHGTMVNHGTHSMVANHSVSTHGMVANHGISTHGGIPSHMVPDHEYCEPGTAPQLQSAVDVVMPDASADAPEEEDTPEIDIMINNVVCSFSVKCHLNLRQIALKGVNVEFRRENGMVTMKLRRPYTTASIWSSGRVTCTGATSEDQAKIAARRYARALQKLGFEVRFQNFRVVNVLGTCRMPFGIRIISFSKKYKEADYEPELHPGVTYKLYNPKATLKIFSTGGVTITARSVNDVQSAVERIFPLVYEFRKPRTAADEEQLRAKRAARAGGGGGAWAAAQAASASALAAAAAAAATAPPQQPAPPADPLRLVTLSDEDNDAWE